MYDIEKYTALIKERLSDYRFYHSLCVAESAKKLAKRYGADEEKAEVAGLLHDAMKESDSDEQLALIKEQGIEVTDFDLANPKFYHQSSGAAFAKKIGITDEEIIGAIRYHTTGRANMTLMEEIVYLADFISADRDYKDIEVIREETEKGKEYGLLMGTAYTIKSVAKKKKPLHPSTVSAYNWILDTYFKQEG